MHGSSLVLQRQARTITLRAVMQLTLSRTLLIHALILIGVGGAIVAYRQMQVKPVEVEEMPEPTPEDIAEIERLGEAVQEFERLSGRGDAEKLYRDLIALQERYLVPEHPGDTVQAQSADTESSRHGPLCGSGEGASRCAEDLAARDGSG